MTLNKHNSHMHQSQQVMWLDNMDIHKIPWRHYRINQSIVNAKSPADADICSAAARGAKRRSFNGILSRQNLHRMDHSAPPSPIHPCRIYHSTSEMPTPSSEVPVKGIQNLLLISNIMQHNPPTSKLEQSEQLHVIHVEPNV